MIYSLNARAGAVARPCAQKPSARLVAPCRLAAHGQRLVRMRAEDKQSEKDAASWGASGEPAQQTEENIKETPGQSMMPEEKDDRAKTGPGGQAQVRTDDDSTTGRMGPGGETRIRQADPVPSKAPGSVVGNPQSGVERN